LAQFVTKLEIGCTNTIAVRRDKHIFQSAKDVVLIASNVLPENSPFYDLSEIKDGVVILEESLSMILRDKMFSLLF
jgi:hypothetical protein